MRSSFTASFTSTQARASGSTARTPTHQAGVRTQAGSSSPIITTNEGEEGAGRIQLSCEPPSRRLWLPGKDRKVVQQRWAKSRATVGLLWELRRPRLLNDGGRGPCGRSD